MYIYIYIYIERERERERERLWYLCSPSPHCLDEWHHRSGPSSVRSLQHPPSAGLPLGLHPVFNWKGDRQISHLDLRKITKCTLEPNWKFKPHKYKKFCILYQPLVMFGTWICGTVFSVLHILRYTLAKFFIFCKTRGWKYINISPLPFSKVTYFWAICSRCLEETHKSRSLLFTITEKSEFVSSWTQISPYLWEFKSKWHIYKTWYNSWRMKDQLDVTCASHKSNPSSVLQGIVDSYSTLPWVTWGAVTVVKGIPWRGLLRHRLANGALVYPSQGGRYRAEGCMTLA